MSAGEWIVNLVLGMVGGVVGAVIGLAIVHGIPTFLYWYRGRR